MDRPNRKRNHLIVKAAEKVARSRKLGKRAKRYNKWIATYDPANKPAPAEAAS